MEKMPLVIALVFVASAPKPAGVAPVAAAATLVLATETVSASAIDKEDEILAEIAEETSEACSEHGTV